MLYLHQSARVITYFLWQFIKIINIIICSADQNIDSQGIANRTNLLKLSSPSSSTTFTYLSDPATCKLAQDCQLPLQYFRYGHSHRPFETLQLPNRSA